MGREYSGREPTIDVPDFRNIHELAGRALMQVLALSHQLPMRTRPDEQRLQTLDDLRQIRPEVLDVADDAAPVLAQVGPQENNLWAWFRYLNEPESPSCVRPYGVSEGDPGRWLPQILPIGADCGVNRYLAHVEYIADQTDIRMLWNRCRGKTPALFVSSMGDDTEEKSQTNAIHQVVIRYQIRVLSANWHGGVQARFVSPLPIERESDPGTQRILGDVRRVLIHDNTLQRCLGVTKVSLGGIRPQYERGAKRVVCDSLQLRVIGYVHTPNAPCEFVEPWRMWLQLQDELGRTAGPENQV